MESLQAIVDIDYSPIEYINNGGSSIPTKKGYIGYKLITTEDEIMVAIDNYAQCCETYGVALAVSKDLESEKLQQLSDFFNTPGNLSGIQILSKKYISYDDNKNLLGSLRIITSVGVDDDFSDMYEHNWGCIEIDTNNGILYLVAWECHNGYYSHNAQLVCSNFKYDIEL